MPDDQGQNGVGWLDALNGASGQPSTKPKRGSRGVTYGDLLGNGEQPAATAAPAISPAPVVAQPTIKVSTQPGSYSEQSEADLSPTERPFHAPDLHGTIGPYRPGALQRLRDYAGTLAPIEALANTPAEPILNVLGIHPDVSENPSDRQLFGHPEVLTTPDEARQSKVQATLRGLNRGIGALSSAKTIAAMAGAAATGGGSVVLPKLISLGFSAQQANELIQQVPQLKEAHDYGQKTGDWQPFYEGIGQSGFDFVNAVLGGAHAAGVEIPTPGTTPEFRTFEHEAPRMEPAAHQLATEPMSESPAGRINRVAQDAGLGTVTGQGESNRPIPAERGFAERAYREATEGPRGGEPAIVHGEQRPAGPETAAESLVGWRRALELHQEAADSHEQAAADADAFIKKHGFSVSDRRGMATAEEANVSHPAGLVTGIDETTRLPIVRTEGPFEPSMAERSATGPNGEKAYLYKGKLVDSSGAPLPEQNPHADLGFVPTGEQPVPRVSTARQDVQLQTGQEVAGEYGSDSPVLTPSSRVPARYKLVEADELQPSHNAQTFAPNPNYPEGVQERAYHTSKEAQNRVIQQAQNYQPEYTINGNPDSVNGPPIVTPDGTVLGGNSRTMSTQRLYAAGAGDSYKQFLRDRAQQFGLTPEQVDRFKQPVLVREVATPPTHEAARRLGSELNKSMTGALGVSERAVSAGKSVSAETMQRVSELVNQTGEAASMRDVLREHGPELVSRLTRDGVITDRERPQFVDTANGGLSEEGKVFVERALLGTVLDDPTLMDRVPKSVINKLDGSLADIASFAHRTDEYNLLPLIREALREHADIAQRGTSVELHLGQAGMFGPERDPAVDALVRVLADKPTRVRQAFRQFAQDANVDRPGQGFLAVLGKQPNPADAFNEAFGANLSPAQFAQSLTRAVERAGIHGVLNVGTTGENPSSSSAALEGVRRERPSESAAGAQERDGIFAGRRTAGAEDQRSAVPAAGKPSSAVEGPTLFAHTPFSAAYYALKKLNSFYDQHLAEPLIQSKLKTGRTHPEVEKADAELADKLRALDNAPKYFRQKADAAVANITKGLSREQERLFTLMADATSRENLKANHPAEYRQALNDPKIQEALKKYKPLDQQLTNARKALGGEVISDDYLRRVYEKYTSGVGKKQAAGDQPSIPYDRVIRPQRATGPSREAEAEYFYKNGLHEFGPAFGTKYVGTMVKVARDSVAREFLSKATAIEPGDSLPDITEYNGTVYYSPDALRTLREAGKKGEPYGIYAPAPNGTRYLGPRAVVDALNGLDAREVNGPGSIKRFFQEQTVGLGFGLPHMANILRRVTQSAPGGAIDPRGWAAAMKVAFSSELKRRGISGVDDPTFDLLAKYGAISRESEVSSFKRYIGGNLNPANWLRPFTKVGHDFLFKPGAIDQRARLYIADLIKSQHPAWSGSKIAQAVNEQLGNYNRANWTQMHRRLAHFALFPGWDMSSMNWVLRHPIKTSVPAALLVFMANQAIHSLGGNKESEKNDVFTIHAGDRAFSTNLINESLSRVPMGAPLRAAQALVEGKTAKRATAEAARGLPADVSRLINIVRPDLRGVIELAANRERLGAGKEITKGSDFSQPGSVLPSKGIQELAVHTIKRLLPQFDRAMQNDGKFDLASFVGGNLGVSNYAVTSLDRLKKKLAVATDYEQAKAADIKRNPKAAADLFHDDPDTAIYVAFRPAMARIVGDIAKIENAKELISNGQYSQADKQAAFAKLEAAREAQIQVAGRLDEAVDKVLGQMRRRGVDAFFGPLTPSTASARP